MEGVQDKSLRKQLTEAMGGQNAHIDFDSAIEDFPPEHRATKVKGAPHTAWQLLEHMRIAQWDILEFSRNPKHKSPKWPDAYWPKSDGPASDEEWQKTVESFRRDRQAMEELVNDPSSKLLETLSHGDGQNLAREALLIANHNSYHLGQLMFLKQILNAGVSR